MPRKIYKNHWTKGGFDFDHAHHRITFISKSAPASVNPESFHQAAFFDIIRRNMPQPPMAARRLERGLKKGSIVLEPVLDDPKYLTDPLYILTRIRHFPNGGYRHPKTANEMQRQGTSPGAFDNFLDAARHGYHGLRVELKIERNELSSAQQEERRWLEQEGYSCHVAWHYAELLQLVLWYCEIPRKLIRGYPQAHEITLPKKGGHDARCGCELELSSLPSLVAA